VSRRKRKLQDDGDKAEIDLTPMLDVVFIMLIFFIVTASFVKERSLNVNVPDDSDQQQVVDTENKSILVLVDAQNEVFIDGRRVDIRSVRSLIAQKNAANPGGSVVVRAHEDSSTETYVKIADAAADANVGGVSLVPFRDSKR
jgi:biopolymer transport protein ExbD